MDAAAARSPRAKAQQPLIDCDVHENFESVRDLLPYLEPQWHRYITEYGWQGPRVTLPYVVPSTGGAFRKDIVDESRGIPGSDIAMAKRHLFEDMGVTTAILNGHFWVSAEKSWFEFSIALAAAYNDWQIEHWLEKDRRFRGSVHIVAHDPDAAVREIARIGPHPQMVQVFLPVVSDRQYGDPFYHPIYAAAERYSLTVTLHHGPFTAMSFGYPRYFIEWHTLVVTVMMDQITSLLCNGVFDKYPGLKVVGLEGGFTWLPFLMRRLDQQYRQLRTEVPWVKRMPSEHLREHLRLTTQPMEEMSAQELMQMIDMMGSDRMLLFSSDWPHWDTDPPDRAMPAKLPQDLRDRIMFKNAVETFSSAV